jgi:capsular polysaccharide biosynthesis protein
MSRTASAVTVVLAALAGVVIGLVAAGIYLANLEPTYRSSCQFLVTSSEEIVGAGEALNAGRLAEIKVQDYADLALTRELADRIVERTDTPLTPEELQSRIESSAFDDSVRVRVTVSDPAAEGALLYARAYCDELQQYAQEVQPAPIEVLSFVLIDQAAAPTEPTGPPTAAVYLAGAMLGLAVGLSLAWMALWIAGGSRDADAVEAGRSQGLPRASDGNRGN